MEGMWDLNWLRLVSDPSTLRCASSSPPHPLLVSLSPLLHSSPRCALGTKPPSPLLSSPLLSSPLLSSPLLSSPLLSSPLLVALRSQNQTSSPSLPLSSPLLSSPLLSSPLLSSLRSRNQTSSPSSLPPSRLLLTAQSSMRAGTTDGTLLQSGGAHEFYAQLLLSSVNLTGTFSVIGARRVFSEDRLILHRIVHLEAEFGVKVSWDVLFFSCDMRFTSAGCARRAQDAMTCCGSLPFMNAFKRVYITPLLIQFKFVT